MKNATSRKSSKVKVETSGLDIFVGEIQGLTFKVLVGISLQKFFVTFNGFVDVDDDGGDI